MKVGTAARFWCPTPAGNDDHVARFDVCTDADGVAKANESMPTIDTQDLVRGAVVMRKRIYAIAPGGSPLVPGVERFDQLRRLFPTRSDGPL